MRHQGFQALLGSSPAESTLLRFSVSSVPMLEKGEQFLRVIEILTPFVATIKLSYDKNFPCFNSIIMLL
jgi:hypothetical protein